MKYLIKKNAISCTLLVRIRNPNKISNSPVNISIVLIYFLIFDKNFKKLPIPYAAHRQGLPSPAESTINSIIPVDTVSELAAIDKTLPRIGPMQGVHPNANDNPII